MHINLTRMTLISCCMQHKVHLHKLHSGISSFILQLTKKPCQCQNKRYVVRNGFHLVRFYFSLNYSCNNRSIIVVNTHINELWTG